MVAVVLPFLPPPSTLVLTLVPFLLWLFAQNPHIFHRQSRRRQLLPVRHLFAHSNLTYAPRRALKKARSTLAYGNVRGHERHERASREVWGWCGCYLLWSNGMILLLRSFCSCKV
jgi:hypothetical protein